MTYTPNMVYPTNNTSIRDPLSHGLRSKLLKYPTIAPNIVIKVILGMLKIIPARRPFLHPLPYSVATYDASAGPHVAAHTVDPLVIPDVKAATISPTKSAVSSILTPHTG